MTARSALVLAALVVLGCDGRGAHANPPASTPPAKASAAASARAAKPAPRASASASASANADADAGPSGLSGPIIAASELTWVYDRTGVGPMQVVVRLPPRRAGQRFPVLIAMHGRGEAHKGPAHGARGWVDDYGLVTALERLHAPPLAARDLENLAAPERLAHLNAALGSRAFGDMVVVCPYTPDILAGDRPFSAAVPLARFLVDELLPRVYRETPALGTPASTGIDGVSLGGRAAVLVGLDRAESFGSVAGLQAAFDSADAPELARRAKRAREKNPKLSIRLLTSDGDFFLRATKSISKALDGAGVSHELRIIPGPHDYVFNRGPGVYEMLVFHDRVLRGHAPVP